MGKVKSHLNPPLSVERSTDDAEILIVTNLWPTPKRPSYGVFVQRQVDSLEALGVKLDVLFIHGYQSSAAYAAAATWLGKLNRHSKYALTHAHGGESSLPARAYLRAPLVVSYCGDDLLGTIRPDGSVSVGRRVRRTVLSQHARLVSATITKSAQMESRLPSSIRTRNRVIPNGVDFALFRPTPQAEARAELRWPPDERVVLFAADPTVERKRFGLARAAVDVASFVLGPIRLEVAVNIAPTEIPVLMNAADCLLLTSTAEGSPNVIKEALACNLPVVATDVGDVALLLRGVEPSRVCEPTAEVLGDALVECLRDSRRSNGRAMSEWLRSETVAMRVLEVYESLGFKGARPPAAT